jgi:transglutaminase-like putative cysteine protease
MFAEITDKERCIHPITFSSLGFGDDIPYNTLQAMKKIIIDSAKNYAVIKFARQIVKDVPAKNGIGEVTKIYNFVRDKSRYVKDPYKQELIQTPLVAIDRIIHGEQFEGDCDDMTVLILSLLKAIGYPVKIISTSYDAGKNLSHVYGRVLIQTKLGSKWVVVEPIKLGVPLGWEAPNKTSIVEVNI